MHKRIGFEFLTSYPPLFFPVDAFCRAGPDRFINAFLGSSLRHFNESLFGFLIKCEHIRAKSNAALATYTFFRLNENFLAHALPHF